MRDPRVPHFAEGLLERLVEIQHDSADVDKEMRYYAEAAAEQLTADPYHGVFEILQNADDLGARHLEPLFGAASEANCSRFTTGHRSRRET